MYPNVEDIIQRVNKSSYTSSSTWRELTQHLETYLIYGDLDMYLIYQIKPHVFIWPQNGGQTKCQLQILEQDKESIFYKTLSINDYGPKGIMLYNNIQLDRVEHVWSIYSLVHKLGFSLDNDEILFEFGAGSGQMADILCNLQFKGRHILYDLPLMTVLQKYFIDKKNVTNTFLLDDEPMNIIHGTNFLPCNQPHREEQIVQLPNINFIATYSLSETDIHTRNKFSDYMIHFSRIYIVYWPGKTEVGDNLDNSQYIEQLFAKLQETHYCFNENHFVNGKVFMAVKKDLILTK